MAKKGTKNPDSTEKQGKKAVMNYMQFINGNVINQPKVISIGRKQYE